MCVSEAGRAELNPQGTQEELFVELMTRALWRLRRLGRVEAEALADAERMRASGKEDTATIGLTFIRGSSGVELQRLRHARLGGYVPPKPMRRNLDRDLQP